MGNTRNRPVRGRPQPPSTRESGIGLLEVTVALAVLSLAAMGTASMMLTTMTLNASNRQKAASTAAARQVIEELQGAPFDEVFALYNEDPADDPNGTGTAPGSVDGGLFDVQGSAVLSSATSITTATAQPTGSHAPGTLRRSVRAKVRFPDAAGVLREDAVDARLGMPMDLNGDGVIDGNTRAADYKVLPLLVQVSWEGVLGPESVEVPCLLTHRR